MARTSDRMTAMKVARMREPGMHADGDGLYLQVTSAGARSWIFRYRYNRKQHEMGLGSLKAVSLADAREKALKCRRQITDGIDPLAARKAEIARLTINNARAITFDQCAKAFIAIMAPTVARMFPPWQVIDPL